MSARFCIPAVAIVVVAACSSDYGSGAQSSSSSGALPDGGDPTVDGATTNEAGDGSTEVEIEGPPCTSVDGKFCYRPGTAVANRGMCNKGGYEPCGRAGEKCCPGFGTPDFCGDIRTICEKGICVACGEQGAVCCTRRECCCDAETNRCSSTACAAACGAVGKPCCAGDKCATGGTCSGGQCVACDRAGAPCCVAPDGKKYCGGDLGGNVVCGETGFCMACGGDGQPCCAGSVCHQGTCNPTTRRCESAGSCGGCGAIGEACCSSTACAAPNCCDNGTCVAHLAKCSNGYTCRNGSCDCGGANQDCCNGGTCNGDGCCDATDNRCHEARMYCSSPSTICLNKACTGGCGKFNDPCCAGAQQCYYAYSCQSGVCK